jgi:hypothetical protein
MADQQGTTTLPQSGQSEAKTGRTAQEQLAADLQHLRDRLKADRVPEARRFVKVLEQRKRSACSHGGCRSRKASGGAPAVPATDRKGAHRTGRTLDARAHWGRGGARSTCGPPCPSRIGCQGNWSSERGEANGEGDMGRGPGRRADPLS